MGGLAALPFTKSTWHEVTRIVPSLTSQRLIDGEVIVHALTLWRLVMYGCKPFEVFRLETASLN